jgi:hypothetical protein
MLTLTACTAAGVSAAQQINESKIDPKLWTKVQEEGIASVIVQLNVPWQPESKLSKGGCSDAEESEDHRYSIRSQQPSQLPHPDRSRAE